MVAAPDEIGNEHSSYDPMRHTVPGIACGNIDVVLIRRITSDVTKTIHWFHDLTGPLKHNFTSFWPSDPRPIFQALKPLFKILGLTGFMILASHNQNLV